MTNINDLTNNNSDEFAEWINIERCGFSSVEATCSACGKTMIYRSWWHYCPNCGKPIKETREVFE